MRFSDLRDPETIPRNTAFTRLIECFLPIVVQHARLDPRQSALGLLSDVVYDAVGGKGLYS